MALARTRRASRTRGRKDAVQIEGGHKEVAGVFEEYRPVFGRRSVPDPTIRAPCSTQNLSSLSRSVAASMSLTLERLGESDNPRNIGCTCAMPAFLLSAAQYSGWRCPGGECADPSWTTGMRGDGRSQLR